jgi:hypothetical protein
MPVDMVAYSMDYKEIEMIVHHLQIYQSGGDDRKWESYRKKVPAELLDKWRKVVYVCRMNGFINPVIISGELTWAQIIGDRTHADQCSVCPKSYTSGSCTGKSIINKGKFDFVPCWRAKP